MGEGFLFTIRSGGRIIEYAVSGYANGAPALLFYPLGGSRRLAVHLHADALAANAQLICINRPGKGGTSPALVETRVDTVCDDVQACLNHLNITKAHVIFMCAGAPYALRFCIRHPTRVSKVIGFSSWVSPADCPETLVLYRRLASLPS